MLLVLPTTSTTRPASYLVRQPYDYYPSHHYHNAPQFSVPSYPAPQLDFFHQPSAAEIEEYEYRQALEVVANHRGRQAEKEAVIRRQQLAEAARQRYLSALAAELEQRRREELLAARRTEFIRSQQARARLVAAGRRHALNALLRQPEGVQPVRHFRMSVAHLILIGSFQTACRPPVVERRPLADALKQRLATESDTDITEPIRDILSSLGPQPVQSQELKDSAEDAAKLVENLLSSIFPGLTFHTQPQPTPSTEKVEPSVSDKGKGKTRNVDVEESKKPVPKSEPADEPFADILRHFMELSKSTPAPRSPDEAGPSGPSPSSLPSTQPVVTEREQAQIDRAVALSSVEHVQDTLAKLQANFALPTELDHYAPSTDDRDETASVSSVSSSDLTKLIPYTKANKPVYKYENELNGLLEELDRIDSHGDAEVREKRKVVVKAIEKALEGVEHVVGEVVEKRLSLTSAITQTIEEPVKGFDVDEDTIDEVAPAQEPVDSTVVVDHITVSESSTPVQVDETLVIPAEVLAHVEDTLSESDVEASTATITPGSVEHTSQVQVGAPETVDTFLLPEPVSPPSPVKKPQEVDSDTDEEVLVLDSDVEKSDWSELEH